MGSDFLFRMFGYVPQQKPPELVTIFPQIAAQRLEQGKLTKLDVPNVILTGGEICHFVDNAAIVTEKKYYESHRDGVGVRVFKGVTWYGGNSTSIPVTQAEYTEGMLIFTNKRVLFIASKNGLEKDLKKLVAVVPYTNGIELQFGNKTYTFWLKDGTYASMALNLIV